MIKARRASGFFLLMKKELNPFCFTKIRIQDYQSYNMVACTLKKIIVYAKIIQINNFHLQNIFIFNNYSHGKNIFSTFANNIKDIWKKNLKTYRKSK